MSGPTARLSVAFVLLLTSVPAAGADAARGERVFQRCYACHSVVAGEDKLPGPNLRCLFGRRAGTWPGFEYSPAMIEAGAGGGLVWTRETLERFLVDPQHVVPGTAMGMPGTLDADNRQEVVDYLEKAGGCAG